MKRINLVVAVLLVAAMAFAPAALAKNGTFEVNAGYNKMTNDTPSGDSMGGGIGFGGAYWKNASPAVSWGAEVSYDGLGSLDYDNGTTTDNKVSANVLRFGPAVRYSFGPATGTSFFAQGGAGYYNVKAKTEDSVLGNSDTSESKIGFNFGAGVNFPVAPTTKMNVGFQYHTVSTEGESTNYYNFRAGVGFNL